MPHRQFTPAPDDSGNHRRSLSKKLRFEVFKRDDFTCQYCGAQPPKVVLEVDHIHPVAAGGGNDPENLITACDKCNRGKGKRLLGDRIVRPDADLMYLKTQQEAAELERYRKARADKDKALDAIVEDFQEAWWAHVNPKSAPSSRVLRSWIATFGPEEVDEAIGIIAGTRNIPATIHAQIKYTSGVLWNRKRVLEASVNG